MHKDGHQRLVPQDRQVGDAVGARRPATIPPTSDPTLRPEVAPLSVGTLSC